MSPSTAIALSGGVDSLAAAYLLKKAGHDLVGLHFLNGFEPHYVPPETPPDTAAPLLIEDPATAGYGTLHADLREMVAGLQMPVMIFDCARPFRKEVIDYFQRTYRAGETPNPCMVCNPRVKFGLLMTAARKLGAGRLATGHYVRARKAPDGRMHLFKGRDEQKDQAYFLARLTQQQLAGSCFPLGDMRKPAVIDLVKRRGLSPLATDESQDVCFIRAGSYGEFLIDHLGFKPSPGEIQTLQRQTIGRHQGLHLFTVGQRRGINCPAREPYYVCGLDTDRNVLLVGSKADLLSKNCHVRDINWIIPPVADNMHLKVRVRYRSPVVDAKVTVTGSDTVRIAFEEPQSAVTPGQGAVFYREDEVLGGGWIVTKPG